MIWLKTQNVDPESHIFKKILQALVAPPGWTSWVQITDRYVLPPNPIEGGYHPGGEPAYVCRHQDKDGKILVGKYSERAGQCLYPYCMNF